MAELADAFVALPGGFGTLDELMEQLTWSQLGLHAKPVGLLDVEDYWGPLIALARHATEEGFVREADLGAIAVADDAEALLDRLGAARDARRGRGRSGRRRPREPSASCRRRVTISERREDAPSRRARRARAASAASSAAARSSRGRTSRASRVIRRAGGHPASSDG